MDVKPQHVDAHCQDHVELGQPLLHLLRKLGVAEDLQHHRVLVVDLLDALVLVALELDEAGVVTEGPPRLEIRQVDRLILDVEVADLEQAWKERLHGI